MPTFFSFCTNVIRFASYVYLEIYVGMCKYLHAYNIPVCISVHLHNVLYLILDTKLPSSIN